MVMNQNQSRTTPLLLVLIVLVVLIGGIYSILNRHGTTKISIDVLPKDSQISINGTKTGSTTHYLKPGTYKLTASRSGFTTATSDITIKPGDGPKNVRLLPTPADPGAITWASEHAAEYQKLESGAGAETQDEGEEFEKKFPISRVLPYKNLLFSIDYSTNNTKNGFKIIVSADTAVDRQYAVKQIQDWGYSPGDYQIEFSGFSNPLEAPR